MTIHGHQGLHDEGHETQVLLRGLTRGVEEGGLALMLSRQTPVIMLARTIDAVEGLLMQEHAEPMIPGHALHERHEQHVMIDGQITLLEDRGEFKLVGRHLIMTGLTGDGEFQGLDLQILHKGLHTIRDGTKVVVVHLLVLRTLVTHQRTTCHQQVRTGRVESLIHEEILLFPT